MALLIPILAVVLGLATAMLTIYLSYRKKKEMFTLYHQERMAAIDKGIDIPSIPDAFFVDPPGSRRPGRDLLRGLIWLFVGLAITVALYTNHMGKKAMYGLIPLGIGLAYLIYYAVEGRRHAGPTDPEKKLPPPPSPAGRPVTSIS